MELRLVEGPGRGVRPHVPVAAGGGDPVLVTLRNPLREQVLRDDVVIRLRVHALQIDERNVEITLRHESLNPFVENPTLPVGDRAGLHLYVNRALAVRSRGDQVYVRRVFQREHRDPAAPRKFCGREILAGHPGDVVDSSEILLLLTGFLFLLLHGYILPFDVRISVLKHGSSSCEENGSASRCGGFSWALAVPPCLFSASPRLRVEKHSLLLLTLT